MSSLYTIGYEGSDITSFLDNVENHGVRLLVDVREKPISHKKGFSKNNLKAALNARGIEYLHLPKLGSPKEIRDELHKTSDYYVFFQQYRLYVVNELDVIMGLLSRVESVPSCLMCFEHDPKSCHRSVVAELIEMYSDTIVQVRDIS
ncbi:MAG TPA: DUF488 domain-containing protein [Negativicutes bacterium]|nr:DUF488 domain-containing protein [Negativicutes bacterium]